MSWICPHCDAHVEPGHACERALRNSEFSQFLDVNGYVCDGCKHLSPTEEEQNRMTLKVSHRCEKLNAVVHHLGIHPRIVKHPNCPGKEVD